METFIEALRVRDVASSASAFVGQMLKALKPFLSLTSFRVLWCQQFARALCSSDMKQR